MLLLLTAAAVADIHAVLDVCVSSNCSDLQVLVAAVVVIATLQFWLMFRLVLWLMLWLLLLIDLSIRIFIDVADSGFPF